VVACRHYFGPWQLDKSFEPVAYRPPPGCLGSIDFATLPEQSTECKNGDGTPTDSRPNGLFVVPADKPLGLDYVDLGTGDARELKPDAKSKQLFATLGGADPTGDTLAEWTQWLLGQGDPTGDERWKPDVPTHRRVREVWLAGPRIQATRFRWGDAHTNRLRDLLRADLRRAALELRQEAEALAAIELQLRNEGKTAAADLVQARRDAVKDDRVARKMLGFECAKYFGRWNDPKFTELLAADIELTPGKPATELTESFDGTDSTTVGQDQTWAEYEGGPSDLENKDDEFYGSPYMNGPHYARLESDLSGSDLYAEFDIIHLNGLSPRNKQLGAAGRFTSVSYDHYTFRYAHWNTSNYAKLLSKRVSGSRTDFASLSESATPTVTDWRIEISGSSLTGLENGTTKRTQTDTAISSGTRAGLWAYSSSADYVSGDDFKCGDLSGDTLHRRRFPRGLTRGLTRGAA